MHWAPKTLKTAYGQLKDDQKKRWRPVPPNHAIFPDRARYPTVELRPNGDVFGSYPDLQLYLRDCLLSGTRNVRRGSRGLDLANSAVEARHILEHSYMERFGVSQNEGRCVALEWEDHRQFSRLVPPRLSRGKFYDIDQIVRGHLRVYREHQLTEWEQEVRECLKSPTVRRKIRHRYSLGRVPSVDQADFEARKRGVMVFLNRL